MIHPWKGKLEQPLFVAGCIDYIDITSENVKQRCNGWHLWRAVMDWAPQPPRLREVIDLSDPDGKGIIQNMRLIAVPLFQIGNLDDVRILFGKLGVELSER